MPPAGQLPDMTMITENFLSAKNSRTRNIWVAALALVVFVGLASESAAQDLGPENIRQFLPRGDLYKQYIADPLYRVAFGLQFVEMLDNGIPQTGSTRYILQAGGRLGILRVYPDDRPELGWQFSIEGGLDSQYDRGSSDDNIGWNGKFGAYLTTARENGWSYKLAVLHNSSHLGDEYIQNTGATRIDYTREEIALGVSKNFLSYYRVYGETGWGFMAGNAEGEKPGRFETGFEIEYPEVVWNDFGWYSAADLSSWQERDWRLNASFQTGLFLPMKERMYRFGIQIYKGRSTLGEFFKSDESQISFGFWVDI